MSNKKLTNNEKVVARIVALLRLDIVLTVLAFRGYYTVGRHIPAVGPTGFAVYGYGGIDPKFGQPAREYVGPDAAQEAAWAIARACGSSRARDAALEAERTQRSTMAAGFAVQEVALLWPSRRHARYPLSRSRSTSPA